MLVTTRDMSIPPLSTSTANNSNVSQMREAVGELENLIAGFHPPNLKSSFTLALICKFVLILFPLAI